MTEKQQKAEAAKTVLKRYLSKEDVYDYLKFANRFDETSGRYTSVEKWLEFAKSVLTEEEYQRFHSRVCPFDNPTPETEELKAKLIDMAKRISLNKAGLYDVLEELEMPMGKYMYLIKQLSYKLKKLNVSCYRKNADYYLTVSSYQKEGAVTCSYPTLGKDMHNKLVDFVKEHNLPLNNVTYTEAYATFKRRGLIKTQPLR